MGTVQVTRCQAPAAAGRSGPIRARPLVTAATAGPGSTRGAAGRPARGLPVLAGRQGRPADRGQRDRPLLGTGRVLGRVQDGTRQYVTSLEHCTCDARVDCYHMVAAAILTAA